YNQTRIPAMIPDGTSNTFLFTEKYARCETKQFGIARGTLWDWYWIADTPEGVGGWVYHPLFAYAVNWNTGIGPVSKFQVQPTPFLLPNGVCDPARPASPHPGGINMAFADGSVRFLGSGLDANIWWAACTPKGGESTQLPD